MTICLDLGFPLTNAHLSVLLGGSYADLTITVVVNVQVPTTGIYRVDNLRFLPVASNGCGGKPNGTFCTDGNACTQVDKCQSGACQGTMPVVCTALDQCHAAGACNTSTGVCSNPNKANGTACNDGNACTQTDKCQSGTCTGTNPKVCTASDQCHVAGTCEASTGSCSNPEKPDGTACNDQNLCTQVDACRFGICTGTNTKRCTALDPCHVGGVCNPATGICSTPPNDDGATCDDGNPCTESDTCSQGVCVGSHPKTCTASNQCHQREPGTAGRLA